jgi:hypothetical protein
VRPRAGAPLGFPNLLTSPPRSNPANRPGSQTMPKCHFNKYNATSKNSSTTAGRLSLTSSSRMNGGAFRQILLRTAASMDTECRQHQDAIAGSHDQAARVKVQDYSCTCAIARKISFLPPIFSATGRIHDEFLYLLFLHARLQRSSKCGRPFPAPPQIQTWLSCQKEIQALAPAL